MKACGRTGNNNITTKLHWEIVLVIAPGRLQFNNLRFLQFNFEPICFEPISSILKDIFWEGFLLID